MIFNNEDEAWAYWLEMSEYEGIEVSLEDQVAMFKEWMKGPNMNLQD